jgi:putative Mg2+ transporter-C (MgtC) family protein
MTGEEAFIRLLVALLLGAAIGLERQWRNHYAGLRTNTLLTIGSAGLMVFAEVLPGADASSAGRIAGQIITGVGFLCAGVIMHEGINIKGLNTAATLWCSVAVGMFAGAGLFAGGCMLTALIILTNLILRPIVFYINSRSDASDEGDRVYTLSFVCHARDEKRMRAFILGHLGRNEHYLRQLTSIHEGSNVHITAELHFPTRDDAKVEAFTLEMGKVEGVISAGWQLH